MPPAQVEGSPHADLAFQPAAQYAPLMDAVYEELAAGVAGIAGKSRAGGRAWGPPHPAALCPVRGGARVGVGWGGVLPARQCCWLLRVPRGTRRLVCSVADAGRAPSGPLLCGLPPRGTLNLIGWLVD